MNVFLNGYVRKNLGDDLFFKLISDRYPNVIFSVSEEAKYLNCSNFNYISVCKDSTLNRILDKISFGRRKSFKKYIKHCDYSVLIGGSMFIEKKSLFKRIYNFFKVQDKYDYIIGVNFGPFYSDTYLKKYKKIFSKSKSVSFRDSSSFKLFSDLNNTSCFPDLVFSYDVNNVINNNDKIVVISVIDCFSRFNVELANNYLFQLKNIIEYYTANNYRICLMSFCKGEGDEKAVVDLLNLIDDAKVKDKIFKYFYDGDVEDALNVLSKSEIIVGSRFHANIIGAILNKKILPIIYSDKMINVLNDLKFEGTYYDIRKKFNVDSFDLTNNSINCSMLKQESAKHFNKLDKVLIHKDDN